MDRKSFIAICDRKAKLVRAEYSLSQEKMALALGLSKKTLVEIEKGRSSLGWTGSIALCHVFQDSEVLAGVFGGNPTDIIMSLAFTGKPVRYPKATGLRAWWTVFDQNEAFTIEQNIISQHFRLLTADGRRILSSFDLDEIMPLFNGRKIGD